MSGNGSGHQDVDIDLAQLFRAVWARKGRLLAATALVTGLAFVGSSMISPSYKGEARVLIEQREPTLTAPGAGNAELAPLLDELNIVSQVQLLRSSDLMLQVIRDLKLYELKEFDPDADASALSNLLVLLGLKKNPMEMKPEDRVLKTFSEKLQVYQVEKSRVIGVEFTSKSPQLAADVPNRIAAVYQSLQSGAKLDSTSEAARWLEPEIANLRDKVQQAEKEVADYRSSSGLLRTSDTSNFATTQLNDISLELTRVRAQRADAEAKAQNVRAALDAGRPTDALEAVSASPVVQRLKDQEATVRAQLHDLSTSLLEGHPRLKGLRAQLAGIREQIVTESARVAATLENDASIARLREDQLLQQLNQAKAESARAGDEEVGLKALEREATAQRQLLETYLARYREATSRMDGNSSPADARVISAASVPIEPSFPKVLPITIVAALATLVLGAVIIMLSELFSGRALRPTRRPDEAFEDRDERILIQDHDTHAAAPVVVAREDLARTAAVAPERTPIAAPAVRREPAIEPQAPAPVSRRLDGPIPANLMAAEADDDLPRELDHSHSADDVDEEDAFSIRSVARYLIEADPRVVFGISPSGDDGSTAMVMLAREIAESGRRVVLIDMTGSGCPTALMASSMDAPGITDLLCGEAAFADVIHADRLSSADLVPQGVSDVRRAMRGADRLSMVTDALSEAYDLVLVECGPANAEGVARLSRNGANEIVLSAPRPDKDQLTGIMEEFQKVGYEDLVLMTGTGVSPRPRSVRAA